jgi:hypothetical protein
LKNKQKNYQNGASQDTAGKEASDNQINIFYLKEKKMVEKIILF